MGGWLAHSAVLLPSGAPLSLSVYCAAWNQAYVTWAKICKKPFLFVTSNSDRNASQEASRNTDKDYLLYQKMRIACILSGLVML